MSASRIIEMAPPNTRPLPARVIGLGLAGATLVAGAGVGAAAVVVPNPVLNGTSLSWLGYGHGKQLAIAVLYTGLAMSMVAWIRLGRDARAGLVDRRGMLAAVAAWAAPLLLAPPLFSRDMFSYLGQGDLALHGYDPYHFGVSVLNDPLSANVDPIWQNTPTPYGPLFIGLANVVVLLTGQSTVLGIFGMRLVMVVGLVLLCWALPRLAARAGGSPAVALWLGAANPLVLAYLVGGGHNDLLMVGLMAAGTVLVFDGRHRYGIALVTLAFAVKATAGVLLPFLVWVWARRIATGRDRSMPNRLFRAGLGALAIVVPVFALCTFAAQVNLGWIGALGTSSAVIEWLSLPTGIGQLGFLVTNLFRPVALSDVLTLTRTAGWLVLIVLATRQWWQARAGDPATVVRRAAITLLVVTLFAPATLPWYFTWPLVLAAALPWSDRGAMAAVFASVWIVLMTYPDGTTELYTWPAIAVAAVAAGLAAISLVRPDPLRLAAALGGRPVPGTAQRRRIRARRPAESGSVTVR